jgi:hypothetical protein
VSVADDKTAVTCPATTLIPKEFMTCTAPYIVKSTDISVENITSTAYATGYFGNVLIQADPDLQTVPRFIKLALNAICSADPGAHNGWKVVNINPYAVNFEYAIDGIAGEGTAPANSILTFETPPGSGTGVMDLYVEGSLQNSASFAMGCN